VLIIALAVLLGSSIVGCDEFAVTDGGAVGTAATTLAGDTSTSETPVSIPDTLVSVSTLPSPTVSAEVLASSETLLPDGHIKACGIIKDVFLDGNVRKLSIDYVDFLTGAEADAAAVAAGAIAPGEHADNDYWVRNVNPRLRTFTISTTVEIYTEYRNLLVEVQPCSWTDFLSFWGPGPLPEGDAHLPDSLWWIERDGDTVVWIRQQFVP
jgi:hypothetical protein